MKDTLCWSCTRPGTNFCSWDRELVPVNGWVAVPTKVDHYDTFRILHCPLYQKEQPRDARLTEYDRQGKLAGDKSND